MKYKIIRDNYLRIDDQVNDHLSTGWELHGYPYAMGSIIMQAMVKKDSGGVAELELKTEVAEGFGSEGAGKLARKKNAANA